MSFTLQPMSGTPQGGPLPPVVRIVGRSDHPEIRDAVALLRAEAKLATASRQPELIVVAQDWPGAIDQQQVEQLRRVAPLAGIVAIVGSWCEGELRTGRPLAGVTRLYWYEFPAWWRRQMERWNTGLCPEWVWVEDCGTDTDAIRGHGLVVLNVHEWDTADAMSDVLRSAGYTTVWQRPGQPVSAAPKAVVAGVWDGGQLNESEADQLAEFCDCLARDGAPVIALFDFPRRDREELALSLGAAGVLGKPWLNANLVTTLADAIGRPSHLHERPVRAA